MKYSIILKIIPEYAFEVTGVETGFTDGINLGNPNFVTLTQPKVAMIVGQGEIHLMQAKYGICLTKSSYAIDQNKYRSATTCGFK
jgi:hypothetical protein